MDYLIFPSEAEAKDRTRAAWGARLGREKNPQDVTEFLWAWAVGKDGQTALIIGEQSEKLTQQEAALLIFDLPDGVGENWEKDIIVTEEVKA
jgi:hypothetical protein